MTLRLTPEDLDQFRKILDRAEDQLEVALELSPEDTDLKSIRRQLTTAFDATRRGQLLTAQTARRLSFGLMADRVRSSAPELSLLLSRLANLLES